MPSPFFDGVPAHLFMPMTPAPASVSVRSRQRTRVSQAESGRILSGRYGGQYYEMSLSYNPMTRAQAAPLIAFLQSREGRHGIFYVEVCGFAEADGLQTANFGNFDDSAKLHMVTDGATSAVTPAARPSSSTLYTDTVYMRSSLSSDVQAIELGRSGLIRLSLDLVERL